MTGRLAVLCVCVVVALSGCASGMARAPAPPRTKASCTAPAGGRCEGPEPIRAMVVSADGRRLATLVMCGGSLRVSEAPSSVRVTYVASAVGPGAMSCARVRLVARLAQPLGDRSVADATTGHRVRVTRCSQDPSRERGYLFAACG